MPQIVSVPAREVLSPAVGTAAPCSLHELCGTWGGSSGCKGQGHPGATPCTPRLVAAAPQQEGARHQGASVPAAPLLLRQQGHIYLQQLVSEEMSGLGFWPS